jgi:hypothetical protein
VLPSEAIAKHWRPMDSVSYLRGLIEAQPAKKKRKEDFMH